MSRSLCATSCYFCGGNVVHEEAPRPATREDCGVYVDTCGGMMVAHAHCYLCEAKYLAWIDDRTCHQRSAYEKQYPCFATEPGEHFDLSFRSSFNDEPGPDDYPKFVVERKPTALWAKCEKCGRPSDDGKRPLCWRHR